MKHERWYEVIGGTLHVYDSPYPELATTESIVPVDNIGYYRSRFILRKVW